MEQLMRFLALVQHVFRAFLLKRKLAAVQARDLERINAAADQLNAEAAEAMEYQVPIE